MDIMAAGVSIRIPFLLQIFAFSVLLLATEGNRDVHYPYSLHNAGFSSEFDVHFGDVSHSAVRNRRQASSNETTAQTGGMEPDNNNTTPVPMTTPRSTTTTTTPKPSPTPSVLPTTMEVLDFNETEHHKYYTTQVVSAAEAGNHWVTVEQFEAYKGTKHVTLSHSHRTAATVQLSFTFLFYGHEVDKVTIATGGFLYMSSFLHQWLTATQYVAPLMANFDTQLGNNSNIYYADNGTAFIVWWEQIHLKDDETVGPFEFQAILNKDGLVIFNYKTLPVQVSLIPTQQHPVKIGLSDAYYIDTTSTTNVRRRTIYEYHRVEINVAQITSNSAIIITPLKTCITIKGCAQCVTSNIGFDCEWCPKLARCSDGLDRQRQAWLKAGCHKQESLTTEMCLAIPSSTILQTTPHLRRSTTRPPGRTTAPGELPIHTTLKPCVSSSCHSSANSAGLLHTSSKTNTTALLHDTTNGFSSTTSVSVSHNTTTEKISTPNPNITTQNLKSSSVSSTVNPYISSSIYPPSRSTVLPSTTIKVHTTKKTLSFTSTTTTFPVSTISTTSTTTVPNLKTDQPPVASLGTKSGIAVHTTSARPRQRPADLNTLNIWFCKDKDGNEIKSPSECPPDNPPPVGPGAQMPGKEKNTMGGIGVGGIIAIVIVICCLLLITAWVVYAYNYPNSKSGMWLIEHRPSNLRARLAQVKFWKRGEDSGEKYEVSVQPGDESHA